MVKKGIKILVGILVVYAFLVATHEGEFWPFSIYPMFSQAGQPWTRALVRDVTGKEHIPDWANRTKSELPGKPFPLDDIGIDQDDLANFVGKNRRWTSKRIQDLREYFKGKLEQQNLLIFKVHGRYVDSNPDSVAINYKPYIYLRSDTTIINPDLL